VSSRTLQRLAPLFVVLLALTGAALISGAVLPVAAKAGAARTETASRAAEIVLNMVVSS